MGNKFNVEADAKMFARAMKNEAIESFNNAVKQGTSTPFLTSLEKQVTYDIKEFNKVLGLSSEDGLTLLNKGWRTDAEK